MLICAHVQPLRCCSKPFAEQSSESRPSRMVAVCSSAASSEVLVIRIDSAAIGMLVGRRIQASDCTYWLPLQRLTATMQEPLAAREGSTATFAGAECAQRMSRVRGNGSARATGVGGGGWRLIVDSVVCVRAHTWHTLLVTTSHSRSN